VNRSRQRLIRILHRTLKQVELDPKLVPNDPAVTELKRSLLRRIADLEVKASPDSVGDRETAEEPEG
jgi:hypothetical protein